MSAKLTKIFHAHKKTFGKYLITGTATLAFNNAILALIIISTNLSELYSVITAAILTVIFGFIVNTTITFKSKMTFNSFVRYATLAAANVLVIKFTTVIFLSLGINVFVITLLNTACLVPLNYLCFKYLIFTKF